MPVRHADVVGIEVRLLRRAVRIHLHPILRLRLQRKAFLHNQSTLHQRCKLLKSSKIRLLRAVYVKVVGVSRGNYRHIGRQLQERTVVLIRLHHHITRVFLHKHIRVVVVAYSAQKRVRAYLRLVHDMRQHGRSRRLTVGARYAQSTHLLRYHPQHLRALLYRKTAMQHILIYRAVIVHRRSAHHQRMLRCQLHTLHMLHKVRVVHLYALFLQLLRQRRNGPVIPHNQEPLSLEITRQSTHADAADT